MAQPFALEVGSVGALLVIGREGWLAWRPAPGLLVRVGTAPAPDGYVARALLLEPLERADLVGVDLRDLPLGRLHSALRTPEVADAIRAALNDHNAPDFTPAAASAEVRRVLAEVAAPAPPSSSLRLEWQGNERDDQFYDQVLAIHGLAATRSRKPVAEIADANGVPTGRVHGWLKEARRRRREREAETRAQAAERRAEVIERLATTGMTLGEYEKKYTGTDQDPLGIWSDRPVD